MAKKDKYYVVWKGVKTGIFETWKECQELVRNYPDARFKSFKSLEEAETAFERGHHLAPKTLHQPKTTQGIIKDSIAVDAACEGNPGILEYQAVNPHTGEKIFQMGPFTHGTNNIGEFLAIVHALALFQKQNNDHTVIYSDSITAISWVRNKKIKTNLVKSKKNEVLFNLIDRAIKWLENNSYSNPVIKWDTDTWGENPADFGRK